MDFYTETPHGFVKLGDPDSPVAFDDVNTYEDDILGGESDSMLGCVGED
jgi:hypothetical protein